VSRPYLSSPGEHLGVLIAQLRLLDFAHSVARQLIDDENALRQLELRQSVRERRNNLGLGRNCCPRLRREDGNDALAEIRMRYADDGGLVHAGERIQLFLDLLRIDVEPARNDEVFRAPDDRHPAILRHDRQVTGDEIAVGAELLLRLLGIAPVTLEDIRAFYLQHANFARRQDRAVLLRATTGNTRSCLTDSTIDAITAL